MSRIRVPVFVLILMGAAALTQTVAPQDPPTVKAQAYLHWPTPTLPYYFPLCEGLHQRVPQAAIEAAHQHPDRVAGYKLPCNPNLAPSPNNPLRRYLGLRNPNTPYHPLGNTLVWKCACP